MNAHRLLIAASLSVTIWSCPLSAQTPSPSGDDWLVSQLHRSARAGRSVDEARLKLLGLFAITDIDGGGVTTSDHELHKQLGLAQLRAKMFGRWMQRDLDADGAVSRTELESFFGKRARAPIRSQGVIILPTEDQVKRILTKLVGDAMVPDTNGDQQVTSEELLALVNKQAVERRGRCSHTNRVVPMTLDEDGDGSVSNEEYRRAVDRVLLSIDVDGDRRFSAGEVSALRARRAEVNRPCRSRGSRF